jgi:protoporphyrinogen oxidase
MKIAIIGAGFAGLAAGLKLQKYGHKITIFEKDSSPGGLAQGFKDSKWQWTLEKHYHHCFTNDNSILNLARKIEHPVLIKHPETTVYVNDKFYKLDSPSDVLKFPELSILQRIRMGFTIALLKYSPFWKLLEKYKVSEFLPKLMGEKAYKLLWEPLILKKFGPYANNISLAWFWARIVKRTPSLAYPRGGFQEFANTIVSLIKKRGGKVIFNKEIKEIGTEKNRTVQVDNFTFDKVIVTLPSSQFVKITPQLPIDYKQKLSNLKGLSAQNLILRLKKPFFQNKTYWLNVCDAKYPLTAIVEHTNFMEKKYYNNEYLVYLGNYLPYNHPFMKMDKESLLKTYDPLLTKINETYKSNLIDIILFSVPFAQPIIPINYSKLIPTFETPLKNVYLANIQQIYPWDRGVNYAAELGEKIADIISGQ